jgi:hypothetical protein
MQVEPLLVRAFAAAVLCAAVASIVWYAVNVVITL